MGRPVEHGDGRLPAMATRTPLAATLTAVLAATLVWGAVGAPSPLAAQEPALTRGQPDAGPAATSSPWAVLDQARRSLAAAGAEQARFVQSYVPAGFSSGEQEEGRIALLLPRCLRWDYDEPFPKSFLLCDEDVWAWNPEDRRGQKGSLDRESQPGLDLLLLPVEDLGDRYEARVSDTGDGWVAILLEPKAELAERTELTEATLVVDTGTDRLRELSYRDREGNRTRFELSGYEPVEPRGLFEAPEWIAWEEM